MASSPAKTSCLHASTLEGWALLHGDSPQKPLASLFQQHLNFAALGIDKPKTYYSRLLVNRRLQTLDDDQDKGTGPSIQEHTCISCQIGCLLTESFTFHYWQITSWWSSMGHLTLSEWVGSRKPTAMFVFVCYPLISTPYSRMICTILPWKPNQYVIGTHCSVLFGSYQQQSFTEVQTYRLVRSNNVLSVCRSKTDLAHKDPQSTFDKLAVLTVWLILHVLSSTNETSNQFAANFIAIEIFLSSVTYIIKRDVYDTW